MKRFWLALAGTLMFANAAHAALASCGSGSTALSSGSTELFGNAFASAQSFGDCYSFSLGTSADSFGGTLTIDPLSFLDINIVVSQPNAPVNVLRHLGSAIGTEV